MFKSIKCGILLASVICFMFSSCSSNLTENAEGIVNIEKELKSKFGDNASYTNINVVHDETVGDMILVTVTDDPASMKMGEWVYMKGVWEQKSDVTLELDGGKPEDFMFNLNQDISFSKIGALAETAKQKVITEKKIDDVVVADISIIAPDNRPKNETSININVEPKNGGTSFKFDYDMSGKLTNFSY